MTSGRTVDPSMQITTGETVDEEERCRSLNIYKFFIYETRSSASLRFPDMPKKREERIFSCVPRCATAGRGGMHARVKLEEPLLKPNRGRGHSSLMEARN